MKQINKIIALFVLVAMLFAYIPANVSADSSVRTRYALVVDGSDRGNINGIDVNYEDNLLLSVKGIARALRDTGKAFSVSIDGDEINVAKGVSFDSDVPAWTEEELHERPKWKFQRTKFYEDGVERKYFSTIGSSDGVTDVYMSPLRLAMMLDVNIVVDEGQVSIDTSRGFGISDVELENSGYLQGVNSFLIGNGTTEEVYYDYDGDEVVPIASTTKLMTYYVLMDAISNGEVSIEDNVSISENAVSLSEGIDGLVSFEGTPTIPMRELIKAMLLSSSNECALALAEHVSGTESSFVERMNEKAKQLGMEEAVFYNCNGLPRYEKQLLPAKMQNRMTARNMFTLVSNLVEDYPEIIDITSSLVENLDTLGYVSKNTNALLYNMDGVKGLKTGTTNKSGACLVTLLPQDKDGITNNLICVLFGAEGELDRAMVAELGLRIAVDKLDGTEIVTEEKYEITPDNPELDVQRMLRNLP